MTADPMLGYEANPAYGRGVTRRRVRLSGMPGEVLAELEDHAHAMRCRLSHADGRITGIEPDFHRYPLNTCPGAVDPLLSLIGLPIGQSPHEFFSGGRARRNCTHMLDLAWLASRHAIRGNVVRTYGIDIPDALDGCEDIRATCDGQELLLLRVENGVIRSPASFAGQHLFRGFASWLGEQTDLNEAVVDVAVLIQKVSLIVPARRYVMPPGALNAVERSNTAGLCHGFAAATIDQVVRRADTIRDFSDSEDRLLRFL